MEVGDSGKLQDPKRLAESAVGAPASDKFPSFHLQRFRTLILQYSAFWIIV